MQQKDAFFKKMDELALSLTYDDVRLRTGFSIVMPDDVDLKTRFSKNVPLNIPIASAAMDTVTEDAMAIALAKLGGIGVIHRSMTHERQAAMVARVKFALNGLIKIPKTVRDTDTIEAIQRRREEGRYEFHSFPVIDEHGKLVGLLTENDFAFCESQSLRARDVMTTELITAPLDTTLDDAYDMMRRAKKKILPLVDSMHVLCGMYVFTDVARIKRGSSTLYNVDANGQLRVAAAIGVGEDEIERAARLATKDVDTLVVDTAHAHTELVLEMVRELKKAHKHIDVVVGNISERVSAEELIRAGADGIKVGQGPGSICTTRIVAGIGCPQVTAIYNCSLAADEADIPLCADGGLKQSGDIPVAIGAGAHSVMMGTMLAGTKESPGDIVFYQGMQRKIYRGMGSLGAMLDSRSARERYGQVTSGKNQLIPEGIEGMVPYRGELEQVLYQYVGGLRRGMGYVGASTVEELREKADFIRLSHAGQIESHPHDIFITEEAANSHRSGS